LPAPFGPSNPTRSPVLEGLAQLQRAKDVGHVTILAAAAAATLMIS